MWKNFKYTKLWFSPEYMHQMGESKNINLDSTAKEPNILERLKH
jgi:hypothetical protein